MEGRPGEEPVESVDEGEAMRLAVQMPRPRPVPRRTEGAGQQVRIGFVELQGEGRIRRRMGLPDREGHRGGIPSPATAGGHETARTILTVAPIRPGRPTRRRKLWNNRTPSTGDSKSFAVRFDYGSNKTEADARNSNEYPESGKAQLGQDQPEDRHRNPAHGDRRPTAQMHSPSRERGACSCPFAFLRIRGSDRPRGQAHPRF